MDERLRFMARLRRYEPPQDPDYPFHDRSIRLSRFGCIWLGSRKIILSLALAEQLVGIREADDQVWQVSFLQYDLGYFDREQDRVEPGPNPSAPDRVLTMCPDGPSDQVDCDCWGIRTRSDECARRISRGRQNFLRIHLVTGDSRLQ